MKMMFSFIGLLLAMLHPTLSHTQVEAKSNGDVIFQYHSVSLQDHSHGKELFVDNDLLDITEDETSNSEKKIFSLGKSICKPFSFVAHIFSSNILINIYTSRYFFILHPSLFIFLQVFRL
jgi:hypothetical protein